MRQGSRELTLWSGIGGGGSHARAGGVSGGGEIDLVDDPGTVESFDSGEGDSPGAGIPFELDLHCPTAGIAYWAVTHDTEGLVSQIGLHDGNAALVIGRLPRL